MRLVFFGSGAFGLPTLQHLAQQYDVALVVSQPDRPAGRHRQFAPTPIAAAAEQRSMPIVKPERVNEEAVVDHIHRVRADAFVVIAFGQKLGRALLGGTFAINLHGSLLPRYRGAAPINWAMIRGERETGITVITLADRMDAGDMLGSTSTTIDPLETAGELHDRLAALGPELMQRVFSDLAAGALHSEQQDESAATHAPKLTKSDGTTSFDMDARLVRCRVHGLTPWPGCTVRIDGRPLRLHRVQELAAADSQSHCRGDDAGAVGIVLPDMTISCASGSIRVLEVQPPGSRLMRFTEYCNGQPIRVGARVESP